MFNTCLQLHPSKVALPVIFLLVTSIFASAQKKSEYESEYLMKRSRIYYKYAGTKINVHQTQASIVVQKDKEDFTISDDRVQVLYDASEEKFKLVGFYIRDSNHVGLDTMLNHAKMIEDSITYCLFYRVGTKTLKVVLWKSDLDHGLKYVMPRKLFATKDD